MRKKLLILGLVFSFIISCVSACTQDTENPNQTSSGKTLTVLNYGKYIEEEVLKEFERQTGIEVKFNWIKQIRGENTKYWLTIE